MDRVVVCAIFKDEAPYLLEWLAFHKMVGADLFVLYDNGSSDGGAELIRNSIFARNVTVIDWPEHPGMLSAYNHFRINHAARATWAAFIDIDEFLMPAGGGSIRDPLARGIYQDHSAILLQRLVFGPAGHGRKPPGLVVENYTRRLAETAASSRHVKSIVRAQDMLGMDTPYVARCTGPACNTRGETVPPKAIQPSECHDVMVVKHYFTKSREEWELKLRRGRVDARKPYAGKVFADMANNATVEDERALRFVPRLRALLGSSESVAGVVG
jgi:hypothetical protein